MASYHNISEYYRLEELKKKIQNNESSSLTSHYNWLTSNHSLPGKSNEQDTHHIQDFSIDK